MRHIKKSCYDKTKPKQKEPERLKEKWLLTKRRANDNAGFKEAGGDAVDDERVLPEVQRNAGQYSSRDARDDHLQLEVERGVAGQDVVERNADDQVGEYKQRCRESERERERDDSE